MPSPTQSWLCFTRQSIGLNVREAALALGTSRSVLLRAEHGGRNGARDAGQPVLMDRMAAAAGVELGSWPAATAADVNLVLWWWKQHPLDRLARCMKERHRDWQTPMRHVTRQLSRLPAVVSAERALDLLLPPEGRPAVSG